MNKERVDDQLDEMISELSKKKYQIERELDVLQMLQAERLLTEEQLAVYNHPDAYRENYSGAMLYNPERNLITRIHIQTNSWLESYGKDYSEKIIYDEVCSVLFPCSVGLNAHIKYMDEKYNSKPSE